MKKVQLATSLPQYLKSRDILSQCPDLRTICAILAQLTLDLANVTENLEIRNAAKILITEVNRYED